VESDVPLIEVIAVAHRRIGELRVFVLSWINQSSSNWSLRVIHDGPDSQFDDVMECFAREAVGRISFECTPSRCNDYGHSLRELGLRRARGDYVLLTNADNYYVPHTVRFLTQAALGTRADVLLFDMVHSHDRPGGRNQPPYSFFPTNYARYSIDMGAAAVRGELARRAGFRDKTHDGDATYFEDVARARLPDKLSICKISQVLLVHN
jgi:hypothetical protein